MNNEYIVDATVTRLFNLYSEHVRCMWRGFSDGTSGKEFTCQCRRHKRCGFDPWVGKIPRRRKWQPTPVLLPGKLHGRRSLAGYSPQGCKALDATEHDQWAHYNIYLTHEDFEAQTDGDLCFRPYHGEVGELEFEPEQARKLKEQWDREV